MASVAPAPSTQTSPVTEAANKLAEATNSDIFFYNSEIYRPFDDELVCACTGRRRRTNALLLLVTEGGDPDAAYRIARCFQMHYEKFVCIVAGYCKSAGTMIVTGAHELVMADNGEIGPLDIQLAKKDELWDTQSGLTIMSALGTLHEKAFSSFEYASLEITKRSQGRVTFKTAADVAVKFATGLFAPIYAQIDPMHVGEANRAQAIAHDYGLRLSYFGKNISAESLEGLISDYPAHGFVIDREEADGLFNNVREPSEAEKHLILLLGKTATVPRAKGEGIRRFLSHEKGEENVAGNASQTPSGGPEQHGTSTAETREEPQPEDIAKRSAAAS